MTYFFKTGTSTPNYSPNVIIGSAIQMKYAHTIRSVFIDAAKIKAKKSAEESKFDWENKIVIKLSIHQLG